MASYTVENEIGDGRSFEHTKSGKEYIRVFAVGVEGLGLLPGETTDVAEMYAARAPIVPTWMSVHPIDDQAFVIDINARPKDGARNLFLVTVTYSDRPFDLTQAAQIAEPQDPVARAPTVNWGAVTTREPYYKDVTGRAVVNSAAEPYDPPLTRDVTRSTLVVTRNELAVPNVMNRIFRDTCNQESFAGEEPGLVKLRSVTGEQLKYVHPGSLAIITYYHSRYEFHIRSTPWDEDEVMDAGLNELIILFDDEVPEGEEPILTIDGRRPIIRMDRNQRTNNNEPIPVTAPVPLDGQGQELAPRSVIRPGEPTGIVLDAIYLQFKPYERLSFIPLQLDGIIGIPRPRPL